MNAQTKHTRGPWRYESAAKKNGIFPHRVMAADGVEICRIHATREADAAFIVRACNAHDELLDQCERAATVLHNAIAAGQIGKGYATNLADLEAAIAKAGAA